MRRGEQRERTGRFWHETGYIFTASIGTPIDPQQTTAGIKALCDQAAICRICFPDLRHSCATLPIKTSVPLVTVQQLLRHSNITTTANIYTHTRLPHQADALGQLDKQLNPESPSARTRKPKITSEDTPAAENGDNITVPWPGLFAAAAPPCPLAVPDASFGVAAEFEIIESTKPWNPLASAEKWTGASCSSAASADDVAITRLSVSSVTTAVSRSHSRLARRRLIPSTRDPLLRIGPPLSFCVTVIVRTDIDYGDHYAPDGSGHLCQTVMI
ncbi:MAG TPA: tyrosine-type recombinase/integrase [Actinocrinis sp.]|nr:tyrosine-type recombinase/integrase [Actinocrinis sp.]